MTPTGAPFSGALPLVLFLSKATLLLAIAFVATIPLRRATAGARHLVWLAALVGVLALPLLARVGSLHVGVLPESFGQSALPQRASSGNAIVGLDAGATELSVAPPREQASNSAAAEASVEDTPAVATPIILSALQMLALMWAGVALALVGWLVAGAVSVRRIANGARELTSPDWTVPLCEVADRLDLDSAPRLLVSDEIEMAFACRALAPTIVLPASAESWSDDRRRAVLMHELAHVKRHDLVGHVFGRLACALYWFHPLVWAAAKNLRAESERACDDLVLSCGTRPSEYAQHLLDMVTSVRRQGAPIMALPMARKKEFEGRMLAILDPAIRRASPGRLQSAAVLATVGVLSLTIAAVAPVSAASRQGVVTIPPADSPSVVSAVASATTKVVDMPPLHEQAVAPRATPGTAPIASPVAAPVAAATPMEPSDPATAARAFVGPLSAFVTSTVTSSVTGALSTLGKMNGAKQGPDSGRVTLLVHILATDADASVRRTAAWGLQDAQRNDARDALIKALRSDASPSVRETAAWALAEYTNAEVISALDAGLRDKSDKVRATSAWAIGTLEAENEAGALAGMLADSDPEAKQLAIWALGQMKLHSAPPALTKALGDDSPQVREIAAWALGTIEDASAAPALVSAFQAEKNNQARTAEMWALTAMGKMSQSVIDVALKSSDPELRRHAVSMLAGGSDGAWPWPWPWPWPRPFPE